MKNIILTLVLFAFAAFNLVAAEATVSFPAPAVEIISTDSPCSCKPQRMKKLWRDLRDELNQDELLSENSEVVTIYFQRDEIRIEDQTVDHYFYQKYSGILRDYGVQPGANRVVEVGEDYIQIGDQTTQGFRGVAKHWGTFERVTQ